MKFVEYSDLKDFIGVTFAADGSNDVIPKLWIITWSASTMVCKWPNSITVLMVMFRNCARKKENHYLLGELMSSKPCASQVSS